MKTKLTAKETLTIGLLLFALFLGAGNMIFPPALGLAAGTNLWTAVIGFLITGVGLPLLGVTAIALSGGDLQTLANRIGPKFSIIFTTIMYLAIGPFFGIPRTGTVAYEIGMVPFLPSTGVREGLSLLIYSLVFFGITYWLALNPTKLVDRIGRILTPLLLIVLSLLVIKSFITPMGAIGEPNEVYEATPFFKGFLEGYLTMDTLAALVFGIVIIKTIKDKGITDKKVIAITTIKAGVVAAIGLILVYVSLAYLGATSGEITGNATNGGEILRGSATYLYGSFGSILLGLAITFACLTTSVGLVSSASSYFAFRYPNVSYKVFTLALSIFSMIVANVGLTQLIKLSIPVLIAIYPIAIALIALSFLHNKFRGKKEVYIGGIFGASLISILDGLSYAGFSFEPLSNLLGEILPLYSEGVGWLVPSFAFALIGYFLSRNTRKRNSSQKEVA